MRTYEAGKCDIAVIGAGHAGIEAALASARLGLETVCFAINLDTVGNMPCNPAIGGTGKGHLVRELDALGGEMAKAADRACIQYRLLNRGKGPAVWSLRAQADRRRYQEIMKHTLERQEHLWVKQAEITDVFAESGRVAAVRTAYGAVYRVKAVVVATGTYLGGRTIVGDVTRQSGPDGLAAALPLTESLEKLGLVTVEDLLRCYPRSYEDRRKFSTVAAAPVDIPVCLELLVAESPRLSRIRKGLELVKARLVDDTGSLTATFFNQSYMKDALRPGETYVVYGKVEGPPGRRQMTNPVCERSDRVRFTGCILPVYALTHGISNNLLAGLARRCVDECAGQLEEVLPGPLRREHALAAAGFACRNIHKVCLCGFIHLKLKKQCN